MAVAYSTHGTKREGGYGERERESVCVCACVRTCMRMCLGRSQPK
jgi:hypothetical protein